MLDRIPKLGEHASRREPRCTDSKLSVTGKLSATAPVVNSRVDVGGTPRGTMTREVALQMYRDVGNNYIGREGRILWYWIVGRVAHIYVFSFTVQTWKLHRGSH